jgi:hypothetical protein
MSEQPSQMKTTLIKKLNRGTYNVLGNVMNVDKLADFR